MRWGNGVPRCAPPGAVPQEGSDTALGALPEISAENLFSRWQLAGSALLLF